MKSKVHPTYKTKYRVANWPACRHYGPRWTLWSPRKGGRWCPRPNGIFGVHGKYSSTPCESGTSGRPVDTLAFLGRCSMSGGPRLNATVRLGSSTSARWPVHLRAPRARRSWSKCCTCGGPITSARKRIVWYLARYQGVSVSDATIYRMRRRHGLRRVPNRVGRRAVPPPSLGHTGPWASRAGRREVPHAPRASRAAHPSRPVHGDR